VHGHEAEYWWWEQRAIHAGAVQGGSDVFRDDMEDWREMVRMLEGSAFGGKSREKR
jgi:hypothetical protein